MREYRDHYSRCDEQCDATASPFLPDAKFGRQLGLTNGVGVKVNNGDAYAMFNFDFADFVKIGLPSAVLRQIFGGAFGQQNVTGIAQIHHALGDIDAGARHIGAVVHVGDSANRPGVNAHAHPQSRMRFQTVGYLHCA